MVMDYNNRKILFVCIFVFTEGITFIITSKISFRKYDYQKYGSSLGGYTCGPTKAIFETDGEFDPTGKLRNLNNMCESINSKIRTDCSHILERDPSAESGVYKIILWKTKKDISVFCDMDRDGGGWTVFHNRFDGSVDFYRNFSEYENGFGALDGEFWLGLKNIQEIANQGATEIRLEMKKNDGEEGYETYKDFKLVDGTNYTLSMDKSSARRSAGISESENFGTGIGFPFSTYDRDMDLLENQNLPLQRNGAWWYSSDTDVNLNGKYCEPGTNCRWLGHIHAGFAGGESLKSSRMLIRRV